MTEHQNQRMTENIVTVEQLHNVYDCTHENMLHEEATITMNTKKRKTKK